jgi:hypothetical protein
MQTSWKTYLFALGAGLALAGAGLVHGFWTDRWAQSGEVQAAVGRLSAIPLDLGEWRGEDVERKPGEQAPGVAGSVTRHYTNRARGLTVVMVLVCGRPGPVATHTPEVCYGASGFKVEAKKAVRLAGLDPAPQFWTSDATRTNATEETRLRMYWAWNGGQGWVASHEARRDFPRHRHPVLHKLYVLRGLADGEGRSSDEACEAFLRVLLPALDAALFDPNAGA